MRYMIIVKSNAQCEAGEPANPELMARMAEFVDQKTKAGVLLACDALLPSSQGTRLQYQQGKTTYTDGPFAETKELVGGYTVVRVASKAEAIQFANELIGVHVESGMQSFAVELRPMYGPEFFEQAEAISRT